MPFNKHYNIGGLGSHAFLSPSKGAWVNYDDEKLDFAFSQHEAAAKGTRLHDLAAQLIKEGIKLPRTNVTLNLHVNDAIGFRMTPEQILYYSDNFWGTTDAISFRVEKGVKKLRIHDLKTGVNPCSFQQLDIYGALFCLEYRENPFELEMEWRIYQNDEIKVEFADPDTIMHIMETGKRFDKRITEMRLAAAGF